MRVFLPVFVLLSLAGSGLFQVDAAESIQPKAPVENFRIPRFAENGFTQWVLRGERGLFQSEQQVMVEGMELRIYSADERKLVELSMESPQAEILIGENRAYSDAPIQITGGNFNLGGIGWDWLGDEKAIEVKSQAQVVFAEGSGASLGPLVTAAGATTDATTIISSDRLLLQTLEGGYRFEFTGNVRVLSREGSLESRKLVALADLPDSGTGSAGQSLGTGGKESMRRIVAEDAVVIQQSDRGIRTERLESFPRENRADLSGLTEVELPGALITGGRIETSPGRAVVSGHASGGRAQMILSETGGLGVGGESQLSEETIILADGITMLEEPEEYRFVFVGRVEVLSGALRQRSDKLTVNSRKTGVETPAEGHEEIGRVYRLLAEGAVVIEQEGQSARADEVCYHPLRETAELTGSPEFSDGESTLRGRRIDLEPGRVVVHGAKEAPVVVQLPEIADLAEGVPDGTGATEAQLEEAGDEQNETTGETGLAEAAGTEPTVVRSQRVVIYHGGDSQRIDFSDDVEVTGTNLHVTSQKMEVYLDKQSGAPAASGALAGDVKRIMARGDVEILQEGRKATCETAELLPADGVVVLTGEARLEDADGMAEGHRITLNRGQRRARVEGHPDEADGRARITLPGLGGEDAASGF